MVEALTGCDCSSGRYDKVWLECYLPHCVFLAEFPRLRKKLHSRMAIEQPGMPEHQLTKLTWIILLLSLLVGLQPTVLASQSTW